MSENAKDPQLDPGPPPDPDEINPNAAEVNPPSTAASSLDDLQNAPLPDPTATAEIPLVNEQTNEQVVEENSDEPGFKQKLKQILNHPITKKLITVIVLIFSVLQSIKTFVADHTVGFRSLDTIGKLKASLLFFCIVLLGVLARYWGHPLQLFTDQNMYDLTTQATVVYNIPQGEEFIKFDQDLLLPQYIVLVNRVVVNLKSSKSSGENPMAAFDIYLHADSQDAGVEIKEREKELQDFIQRVTEDFSYDQLVSESGKKQWKINLKSELNMVLNSGKIKNIYFKTLLIKP